MTQETSSNFITSYEIESPFQAKVFIDNPAGKSTKNLYNEKTLEYLRSVNVAAPYPFPYGFLLKTTSGDGDNLDCFVITTRDIAQGDIVTVEPIGVMEVIENGEADNKVLAQLTGEDIEIDEILKARLTQFINDVFSDRPEKQIAVGSFLDQAHAVQMVQAAKDSQNGTVPANDQYDKV